MSLRSCVCVMFLVSAAASNAFADVTIDSFQDPEGPLTASFTSSPATVIESFPHVIGGRGLGLIDYAGASVDITSVDGISFLEYSSSVGAAGELSLNYGASIPNYIGNPPPTQMALTVNPATNFLQLSFMAYNHAEGQDMTVDTVLGSGSNQSGDIATMVTTEGAQEVDIPLTDLPGTKLDFIEFTFEAPESTGFQLDSVTLVNSVPEPGTIGVFALFLPLLGRRRAPHA